MGVFGFALAPRDCGPLRLMTAGTAAIRWSASMAGEITGFLRVVRVSTRVDPVNAEYRIVFAPLGGRLRGRRVSCQGSTRSPTSCGRPVFRSRTSNGPGRPSWGAGFTQLRASPWRQPSSRRLGS